MSAPLSMINFPVKSELRDIFIDCVGLKTNWVTSQSYRQPAFWSHAHHNFNLLFPSKHKMFPAYLCLCTYLYHTYTNIDFHLSQSKQKSVSSILVFWVILILAFCFLLCSTTMKSARLLIEIKGAFAASLAECEYLVRKYIELCLCLKDPLICIRPNLIPFVFVLYPLQTT